MNDSVESVDVDMADSQPLSGLSRGPGDIDLADSRASNFMDVWSKDELRDRQLEDPDLKPVMRWLEDEVEPSENELQMQSVCTRHYWGMRAQLLLAEGVLLYQWETSSGKRIVLMVPETLKTHVLKMVHDTRTAGHLGREKTLEKLRLRGYWKGLAADTRVFVATCARCSKSKKPNRKPKAPLTKYQAGLPGDRVHLDIIGPFCESVQGNRYVLMIIDQFTRWLEMVALPTQGAEIVAKSFFESYVVRFGVPLQVHTDQGRNFESCLFKSFCALLEVAKSRTTPYRPSANGQVERYNQLVLNYLRSFLAGKQREWDQYIPVLGMAVRATVNRSTGFTPNMLQLGREVVMPVDIWLGLRQQVPEQTPRMCMLRFGEIYGTCSQP